jgi:hypothetical protein
MSSNKYILESNKYREKRLLLDSLLPSKEEIKQYLERILNRYPVAKEYFMKLGVSSDNIDSADSRITWVILIKTIDLIASIRIKTNFNANFTCRRYTFGIRFSK